MRSGFDFITPINQFGAGYEVWLTTSFLLSSYWQWTFAKIAPDDEQKNFHKGMRSELLFATLWVLLIYFQRNFSEDFRVGSTFVLAMFPLIPLGTLVRKVQKFNFLQIGRQRNLIYAVFLTFVALLYLSFVRRVSLWMEPTLPPEATAAILLFLPVVFFEPLQRKLRIALRKAAQGEMDVTQRMMGPIREVARRGDTAKLIQFVEQWVAQQLELANVQLLFAEEMGAQEHIIGGSRGSVAEFPVKLSTTKTNKLRVTSHGAMLSGETWAAIEFLCEELPSILDFCHLLEEKLQLERELAGRERLALLGQTAASISHNLKNPLGAIKTILQVQMENPEMPDSMRGETKMVLEEIGRLSTKLNQLLQFSRPAVRSGSGAAQCYAREVLVEAASVLRPLAEERGIILKLELDSANAVVAVPADVLNDIASNLLVNALEAVRSGGHVTVNSEIHGETLSLFFDDDGPGIPESLREKILQPFFTTKSQGTGLGLAIVARRVAEYSGKLEWESPLKDAKGTRFKVILPIEEVKK
jgi:signal transduction histidine kinase